MKLERSKNAIRNIVFGTINKLIAVIFPFAVRTIFIYTLGVEYLGLNSLFQSILTVLNLTELGFGSAIVFCMYKPIADDDEDKINALLFFYKKVYRYVGCIILLLGLLVVPFLGKLIKGEYPTDINLTIVYLIFLVNTSISYFLFAYLGSIISAYQREDVLSKINIFIQIASFSLQVVALILIKNYYCFILILPLFTVINNIRTAIVAKKMFPNLKPAGTLSDADKHQIKEKISGLVISKVTQVSRNAFDSIYISIFLGLTDTAIYNNYYYIISSIIMFTSVILTSIVAGAGNSVSLESKEKNYSDMKKMDFAYMWLTTFLVTGMLCLYQPFMELWVGKDLMYPMHDVVLFCIYFYVLKMSDIRYVYELANGLWWENRYRSIAEAICNLTLNYLFIKYWGVTGILLATIFSVFFINYIYGSTIIFRVYFKQESIFGYYGRHLKYIVIAVAIGTISFFLCRGIKTSIPGIAVKGIIAFAVSNLVLIAIYHNSACFLDCKNKLFTMMKKRYPFLKPESQNGI